MVCVLHELAAPGSPSAAMSTQPHLVCSLPVLSMFDFAFPENGLAAYKDGELIAEASFKDHLGEDKLKNFINFVLRYLADVECPVKRYVVRP